MIEDSGLNNGGTMKASDFNGCPIQPDINELTSSVMLMASKVDSLVSSQRDITRWLLIVVCVIALGRSALDLGKNMLSDVSPAKATEVEAP